MRHATYIHGTDSAEQAQLTLLNRLTNQAFIDFLSLGDVSSILEIGSGLGLLAEQIATLVPQSAVWGLEYSLDQLNVARDRLQEQLGGDGLMAELRTFMQRNDAGVFFYWNRASGVKVPR